MEKNQSNPAETTAENISTNKAPITLGESVSTESATEIKENAIPKKSDKKAVDAANLEEKKIPLIYKVEAALRSFQLRYNEITRQAEWHTVKGYEPANLHTLRRHLMYKGCDRFSLNDISSLMQSGYAPIYNPYTEYFGSLKWDGQDHIAKLASYVKTTDNEFFHPMLKKMLVRTVACALHGKVNRYVFTLYSKEQSVGKSTWIRFLTPPRLSRYFGEGVLDGSKDSYLRMGGSIFIWSLEELSSLNSMEINKLKHIISLSVIVERPPFEPHDISIKRRVSFFASTNRPEFLSDVTGNSRWLVFSIESIDFKYSTEVDIDQVWAQAYALQLDKAFNAELTIEETRKQELYNSDYEVTFADKEAVMLYLRKCGQDEGEFMTNQQILDYLHKASTLLLRDHVTLNPIKFTTQGIGRALGACDFVNGKKYINGVQCRGWFVIKEDIPTIRDQAEMDSTKEGTVEAQKADPTATIAYEDGSSFPPPSDITKPIIDIYEGL